MGRGFRENRARADARATGPRDGPAAARPRVWRVRLGPDGECAVERVRFVGSCPEADVIGGLGGSGLAAALLLAWAERRGPLASTDPTRAPLVLAVGPAVRRGLPTAARVTVASRAPLGGRLGEGQVGSDLAARLAGLCDALVVERVGSDVDGARDEGSPRVLVLERDGAVRLEPAGDLAGLTPGPMAAALEARFGPHAALRVGPAGLAGVAFASLAAGGERPSFVGRGGLGAVLGGLGLVAIVVRAEPGPVDPGAGELTALLGRSPRLAARGEQGTAELWHALSARGELFGPDARTPLDPETGRALSAEARAAGRERHGCRGCPTPCGWVFERSDGRRQRSHFGATHAVGPALGLDGFDASLALLAACDAHGVDAKEAGAVLATWCEAVERGLVSGPDPRGDRAALEATLARLLAEPRATGGAAALARALGLDPGRLPWLERTVRPGVSGAALLGQCVSSGGSDPMRSFTFLADDAPSDRVAALTGLADPTPGRLVWWHESLVAALDATGFCAFSAAGLLADGVADLESLARALGYPGGEALIAAGAGVVLLRRELEARLGAPADRDRPPALAEALDRPGLLDDYRAARGIAPDGRPLPEALAAIGSARLARPWSAATADAGGPAPVELARRATPPSGAETVDRARRATAALERGPGPAASPHGERRRGGVRVRATGPLADALGPDTPGAAGEPSTVAEGGATVADVLAELGRRSSAARRLLGPPHAPLVVVWRAGTRLAPDAAVHPGDTLDLVLAIAGG